MARTQFKATSAATTNATSVNGSACELQALELINTTGSTVFFKVYDKATAPVVGTDVPVDTIPVAANANVGKSWDDGLILNNGLAYAITGLEADTDTTAVAAGALKVLGEWF